MSTTSTAPEVLDSLLELLPDAVSIPVFEVWPGPEGQFEMVVFGAIEWEDYVYPTIKAGRKQRQEGYSIHFEVWRISAEGTVPAIPKASRDRVFELFGQIEDAVAEDVTAGTGFTVVQHITARPGEAGPRKFEKGWGYRLAGSFDVEARLT